MLSFVLIACIPVDQRENSDAPKNIEEVGNYYGDQLIEYFEIASHGVLVKYHDDLGDWHHVVNFDEGKTYQLPIIAGEVSLEKVINENEFLLLADGKNQLNSYQEFPYLLHAIKGSTNEYSVVRADQWRQIGESIEPVPGKTGSIRDIATSFDGLQIMFQPKVGDEVNFYAAYTDIPTTEINFDGNNSLLIKFTDASMAEDINLGFLNSNHLYIQDIQLSQADDGVLLTLVLSDEAKEYFIFKKSLDQETPIFDIRFK